MMARCHLIIPFQSESFRLETLQIQVFDGKESLLKINSGKVNFFAFASIQKAGKKCNNLLFQEKIILR